MTDPKRLLEDTGALSEAERHALIAARELSPPASFAGGSWADLAAKIGDLGGPGGDGGASGGAGHGGAAAGGAAAKATGLAGLLGKAAALSIVQASGVGAVLGALVTTALVVASGAPRPMREAPAPVTAIAADGAPRPAPPRAVAAAAPAGSAVPVVQAARGIWSGAPTPSLSDPLPASSAVRDDRTAQRPNSVGVAEPTAPSVAVTAEGVPAGAGSTASFDSVHVAPSSALPSAAARDVAPVERLRAEARLVAQAREALRAGNAGLAARQLDEARRLFPNGGVRQEREALAVEALVRLGRKDLAAERARSFVRDFPGSPFAARVKALTAEH